MDKRPAHILPVIVLAQFAGTALWFSGNAVLPDLQREWGFPPEAVGWVTTAVHAGFIAGTLVFAFLSLADRFSPRLIFLVCALFGGAANGGLLLLDHDLWGLLALRFAVGFFIAGIYPVGMKITSGWFQADLGRALGYLVGALVLGTAFPHLVRGVGQTLPWAGVIVITTVCAMVGGALMALAVPDGPYLKPGKPFDPKALGEVFRSEGFRASSFGYFGHMWELYAFWAFLPVVLAWRSQADGLYLNVPLISFMVIAVGVVGSVAGGVLSLRYGSAQVGRIQLAISGLLCLFSPLLLTAPLAVTMVALVVWGVTVVGDSPQFSALNAQYAPPHLVGSALTIANCIGFGISIASIQLLSSLLSVLPTQYLFLLLVPGPLFGVLSLKPLLK
ncbi:MAG: MFS transporter [Hyphomicrobiaceae bacterium]